VAKFKLTPLSLLISCKLPFPIPGFQFLVEAVLHIIKFLFCWSINMDLGEVGWGDVDWIGLAHDRNRRRALVNSVLHIQVQ
jgi:hypothetical protein